MDNAKKQIEEMFDRVLQNRKERERRALNDDLNKLKNEAQSRNMFASGWFFTTAGKVHGEYFQRILDQTIEELDRAFKEARRRDGDFFWDAVNAKFQAVHGALSVEVNNMAVSWVNPYAGGIPMGPPGASSGFQQYGGTSFQFIVGRIGELKARSRFVAMKSPQDRRANQIPDVAVMMWFPKKEDAEGTKRANEKYDAILQAVNTASKGLATVNKVDDPTLVHRDRITPVVEEWLSKAVLVICDLEENRPNVFYEFGFARAMGTDVIATCPMGAKTDFHLAQWTIDYYSDWEELKAKIAPRIERIVSQHDLSGSA